ncbi:MAG: DNA polymerase [Candidatus Nanoarchaeia archaeon]|nr:DNA polymerase [Candidatus Nanoarchaeia archaeon]
MEIAFGRCDCESCTLARGTAVPGHGREDRPSIMIVGEAPNREDVDQKRPFSGRGGRILRETLTALGVDTSDVYYTYACCCRPPGSRAPHADDIRACHDRLVAEIEWVRPAVVVAAGGVALVSLLGGGSGITRRRGVYRVLDLPGGGSVGVIPTLSPASILHAPDGFRDLANDLDYARRVAGGEEPVVNPPYGDFVLVRTTRMFEALCRVLRGRATDEPVAVDIETTSLSPREGEILSIGFSWRDGDGLSTWVLDYRTLLRGSGCTMRSMELHNAMADLGMVFHNAQFDLNWLRHNGYSLRLAGDTMLASYCLDERQGSHGLKGLAARYFRAPEYDADLRATGGDGRKAPLSLSVEGWDSEPGYAERVMRYNGADAYYTLLLYEELRREMDQDGVSSVHDDILVPAVSHFIRLEQEGMLIDTEYHERLGEEWRGEIADLEARLRAFPGAADLNLRSTKQVSDYLFRVLGLRRMPAEADGTVDPTTILAEISEIEDDEAQEFWRTSNVKRGTKAESTGTYMLYWLAQQHEFPRLLVKHRLLTKAYGAYYDGYKKLSGSSGRIWPRYRLHGTRTGRLSSTDPNIHGMPRRKAIKRIFSADPGMTIISADYSQAEIRMVAHLADDDTLVQALHEADIHRAISKQLFGLTDADLDAMSGEERSIKRRAAKTIAFGLIYGRSAQSLAPQMGVSVPEAEAYMEKFFRMMPKVRAWIAKQHSQVMVDREVVSLFGRKRRFPVVVDRRHAAEIRRQAVNFPVQSSVSDMTLLANLRVIRRLEGMGIPCQAWPHVHDGYYYQVDTRWVSEAVRVTAEEMHQVPFETRVPFAIEIEAGTNWGELRTVYEG